MDKADTPNGAPGDLAGESTASAAAVAAADVESTQVMDAVPGDGDRADQDAPADADATQVMDPVEPESNDTPPWAATMPPSIEPEQDGDGAGDDTGAQAAEVSPTERNWMGVVAFVTSVLFVSIVAIVLGHLGLAAAKKGRANNRGFALAGTVLGYVGLIATAVGAYFYFTIDDSATIDAHAQQDVAAVGAAAATQAVETGLVPDVAQEGADYVVAGTTITSALEGDHTLTFTGTTAMDWCLDLTYEGGTESAFHYTATGGMAPGACPAA